MTTKLRKKKTPMNFAPLHSARRLASLLMRYLFAACLFAACEEAPTQTEQASAENAEASPEANAEANNEGHAPPGVTPGSHEDWCGGHGVPESLCTRCNPTLIGAFQATGDWCPEHQLPESQCTICNPDLVIERPPRTPEATP